MQAGCCGQSSSHSWLQSCAHGSFTCSRQGSSAPSESASLPWRCQCGSSFLYSERMGFVYSAWRDPARRGMTIFWDVGTFWPRSYHPLSPPCYAERAVPDLQRRMAMLHDIGRKVILAAHGQGTMLATAALVQLGCRAEEDRPALVTFGSTVGKLYSWAFPAYVTPELLASLKPGGKGRLRELAQPLLSLRSHRRTGSRKPTRGRRQPGGPEPARPGA